MDNFSSMDFINNNAKILFKEITGLDLENHTNKEWQDWYHKIMRQAAQEDTYEKEILDSAEQIIENGDYSQLCSILRNYDHYVKLANDTIHLTKYPFWCYAFGMNPENIQEE